MISKAALKKIYNHLWYLIKKKSDLAFFDNTLENDVKQLMVQSRSNKLIHNTIVL